ncbi:MAG: 23S rRNA (adenine(2503)-C(2))-methyltransferase RlmN, partial [Planctomycetes bacterium]|nr:23S rRNA (adenine(2503)-C(2))-methyltransferase RlmN [Planctomycetota bacterium]
KRNLRPGEIVEQLLHVLRALRADERISNVVYMGLGEPLANYDHVLKSIRILNADWGLGVGARKITISTVGLPKPMARLADEGLQVNLAISLHAPDDATRNRLVPANRRVGLARVLEAARDYVAKTGREITFEYVLVDGVNCSAEAARKLARLLRGVQANVNVIPCNPVPDIGLVPPRVAAVTAFVDALRRAGVNVNLRKRRGDDISAACGQLRLREAQ